MALSRSSALALLELGADASRAEINHAYRRLAREVHPDRCGSPDAAERFARLRDAYARALQADSEPMGQPPVAPADPRDSDSPGTATFYVRRAPQDPPIVAGPVTITPPRRQWR